MVISENDDLDHKRKPDRIYRYCVVNASTSMAFPSIKRRWWPSRAAAARYAATLLRKSTSTDFFVVEAVSAVKMPIDYELVAIDNIPEYKED